MTHDECKRALSDCLFALKHLTDQSGRGFALARRLLDRYGHLIDLNEPPVAGDGGGVSLPEVRRMYSGEPPTNRSMSRSRS